MSQLWAHADDSAFGNLWTNAVTHEGDQPGTGGQGFTGVIDDAAFYNLSLTEEQVLAGRGKSQGTAQYGGGSGKGSGQRQGRA